MEYTVKALADLAGVTPRTLRWYDRIGLLKPLRTTEAGYRLYGPAQLDRLQDILFYRELGLDLASIRTILDDPAFDRQAALQSHLAELEARRARLDDLILTVQRTINDIKGGTKMTDQEKFEAFKRRTVEANETAFGQEIREKYGDEEMDRANACVLALTQEEYAQWKSLGGEIHTALVTAVKAGADPAGPEGQRIAALHRRWPPGSPTRPRPMWALQSCMCPIPGSPPTMTGKSPAAPPFCGMPSGPTPARKETGPPHKGRPCRFDLEWIYFLPMLRMAFKT